MIKITCEINDQKISSIIVKGHANQDVNGKDIVCSAVSAVIVGGANALTHRKDFEIKMSPGLMSIKALNEVSKDDEITLQTILTQLSTIEESYGQYVQITRKEK